jgi:acyl carrier protein
MRQFKPDSRKLTDKEIFNQLKEILFEVAPLKVVDEITPETSLVEDFAFDSIDIMQMLLRIQERFAPEDSTVDMDKFLQEAYNDSDGQAAKVKTVCRLIAENLE